LKRLTRMRTLVHRAESRGVNERGKDSERSHVSYWRYAMQKGLKGRK